MTAARAQQDRAAGRERRATVPRSALATLSPSPRAAVDILVEQNESRLPDLVPLRFARMLNDPFAFYRGGAAIMAADLAHSPSSGIDVLACGDAHVSNFGLYGSPQRDVVFDLNDFDESSAAPWEWDVKRLVTSAIVGGRQAGHCDTKIDRYARATCESYVNSLQSMMRIGAIERYFMHVQPELLLARFDSSLQAIIERTVSRARKRTSDRVFRRTTQPGPDGRHHEFREEPPVLTHLPHEQSETVHVALEQYLASATADIALLLSQFTLVDVARRVVGVGSVGTRCFVLLLIGPKGEPLILQVKEANHSVLETYGGVALPPELAAKVDDRGQGGRVVGAQRSLQAVSDPFLGYCRAEGRDYYVRQFKDMKGSVDLDDLNATEFGEYAAACGVLLARAHAQSASASIVQGYIGKGKQVVDAIVEFGHAYADKTSSDYAALKKAAATGQIEVAPDPLR